MHPFWWLPALALAILLYFARSFFRFFGSRFFDVCQPTFLKLFHVMWL